MVGAKIGLGSVDSGARSVPDFATRVARAHEEGEPPLGPIDHHDALGFVESGEIEKIRILTVIVLDVVVANADRRRGQESHRGWNASCHEIKRARSGAGPNQPHPLSSSLQYRQLRPKLGPQARPTEHFIRPQAEPAQRAGICVGTLAEMTDGDIYDVVDTYSRQNKLAYVHLRNVRGKVPTYKETFIDDGDVDVLRVLRILKRNHFNGVIIPDHAPQMSCAAPWHAGMAYALGYLRAGSARI